MRALFAVIVPLSCSVAIACGGAPVSGETHPLPLSYLDQVRQRIELAREEPSVLIRHNPTGCNCPPYEVQLGGVWHRAAFAVSDEEDETMIAIETRVAEAHKAGRTESWPIQTRIDDTLTTCGRGAIVVRLAPTEFGSPQPAGEDEE